MYVCVCHAVTDGHIRECANAGACKMRELRQRRGLASSCGKCTARMIRLRMKPYSLSSLESAS